MLIMLFSDVSDKLLIILFKSNKADGIFQEMEQRSPLGKLVCVNYANNM